MSVLKEILRVNIRFKILFFFLFAIAFFFSSFHFRMRAGFALLLFFIAHKILIIFLNILPFTLYVINVCISTILKVYYFSWAENFCFERINFHGTRIYVQSWFQWKFKCNMSMVYVPLCFAVSIYVCVSVDRYALEMCWNVKYIVHY